MATIANLDVNLRAQTQKYETAMKRAGKSTSRFSDRTKMAAKGTESFQARLTAFATKGLVAVGVIAGLAAGVNKVVQNFASLGDEIGKAAARTQLSTDDFQTLSFAFEQSGGTAQELETAIRSMSTQYLELQKGTATSTDLFNRLGLSLSDLQGLDVGDQFRTIAKSVSNIRDPLERAAVATKLFGRSGTTILPLIQNLDAYENRLRSIGGVIDESAIRQGEELTDLNNELTRSFNKLLSVIGPAFTPVVKGWTMIFADLSKVIEGTTKQVQRIANALNLLPKSNTNFVGITQATRDALARGNQVQEPSNIVRKRLKVKDPLSDTGSSFLIDRQINTQKELISALREQNNRLAPLAPALQKGSAAQLGFVAQLQRQNQQAKIDAREKRKIDLAEKHLKELEKIRKQRESESETEIAIL